METEASKEKLPASDSHPLWHVTGWLMAVLSLLAASPAVVMTRTHAVSAERSQRTAVANKGPRVLVSTAQTAPARRRVTLPATIQGFVFTRCDAAGQRHL